MPVETTDTSRTLLAAEAVSVHFGGIRALSDVTLTAQEGQILGLIGGNGAGKTTLVNVLTGFIRPSGGTVRFESEVITDERPQARATRGIVRTFQGARVFGELSVRENIEVGALAVGKRRRDARQVADALLSEYGLARVATRPARVLTAGQRRRLGMARAMAADPKVLLLDEPAAGLNADERSQFVRTVRQVCDAGKRAVILIEHSMSVVMAVSDRVHVLERGRTLAVGSPSAIRADAKVQAAYLGGGAGDSGDA